MVNDDYEITIEYYELWKQYKKTKNKELIEMFVASLFLFVVIYSGWL